MIVIMTGLTFLSLNTIVLMIAVSESSQWIEKDIMWSAGKK